jgi:hypothetical protein
MRALWISVIFISAVIVSGCKYSDKYETVEVNKEFSLAIPSWLKKEDNLKPGAPFQYANRFRNFYAIAEPVAKGTDSAAFITALNANLTLVKKAMNKPMVTDSVAVDYSGTKGIRVEVMGEMSGEKIYFSEVMLDGKKSFYHLSIWTRSEERKLKFKEDIGQILTSFKEL